MAVIHEQQARYVMDREGLDGYFVPRPAPDPAYVRETSPWPAYTRNADYYIFTGRSSGAPVRGLKPFLSRRRTVVGCLGGVAQWPNPAERRRLAARVTA